MTKYKDIVLNIFEEYVKLILKKDDEKSLGKHKGKSKRQSKEG